VTHTKSLVIQSNDQYAHGMDNDAFTYQRENSLFNKFLYNGGSEKQTDIDASIYDMPYRGMDVSIGRMMQVDPLADDYSSLSPFNFANNDPIYYNDPFGASPIKKVGDDIVIYWDKINDNGGTWNTESGWTDFGSFEQAVSFVVAYNVQMGTTSQLSGSVVAGPNGSYDYYYQTSNTAGNYNYNGDQVIGATAMDYVTIETPHQANPPRRSGTTSDGGSAMAAALVASGVLLADDATVVGAADDVIIPIMLGAAYLADQLSTTKNKEPEGVQYTLRAKTSGFYPTYSWGSQTPGKPIYLNAGEIWKIGETMQYDASSKKQWRYSTAELNGWNVEFTPEFSGAKKAIVAMEGLKIIGYVTINGNLPPGNKGFK